MDIIQNLDIKCMAIWSSIDSEYNTLVSQTASSKVRIFLKCEAQKLYNIASELDKLANESGIANIQ